MPAPRPASRNLEKLALALFCLTLIALVWAAALERSSTERTDRLAEVQLDHTNLAIEAAAQVQQGLGRVEQMLAVVRHLHEEGAAQPEFDHLLSPFVLDRRLVSEIGFIDAGGRVALTSQNPAGANAAASAAYAYHRLHDDALLLIGKPLPGPAGQGPVMSLSLRVVNAHGSFDGIAFADVRLDRLTATFGKSRLSADDYLALVGDDGVIRSLHAGGANSAGEDLSGSALLAAHATRRDGSFRGTIGHDRAPRLASYVSLEGFPLFVTVGSAEATELAQVNRRRQLYKGVAALVSALILTFAAAGTLVLDRRRRLLATLQVNVSESRAAQAATQRLSRLYHALSACNQAIVHSRSETELFNRVCRAAVDNAGMSMACVMRVVPDTGTVEPAAAFGDGVEFLRTVRVTVSADEPSGRGLIGTAIRADQPQWSQDYANDPRTVPWRDSALRFGWASGAAMPLHQDGVAIGVLFLFASVTDAFDAEVRELLVEMATDISHALNAFARQAERLAREQDLRTLGRAIEHSPVSIVVVDTSGKIEFANPKAAQNSGYTLDELIGQNPRLFQSGQTPPEVYRQMWAALNAQKTWQGELLNRRKDGSLFWEHASISPILDQAGRTVSYVAVKEDITERKAHQAQIEHLAFYDALTHLPNRSLLADRLAHALASAARSGRLGALLFIDLDDFKTVNDTRGHEVGDQLLMQAAKRLVGCVREADTVARLGGDEFVVMLEGLNAPLTAAVSQVEAIGEKLRAALHQPYQLVGHPQRSSASIGVAFFGDEPTSVDELMKRADLAMYQAKEAGRDAVRFYDPAIQVRVMARASLESELRRGIREGQFLLHYQPQADALGRVGGAEALLRWQHPERGLVSPLEFIPLAEETGLILPLGHWVLETACGQLVAWSAAPPTRDLTLAVNVSARQFRQTDFVDQVLAVLDRTGADPGKLKLELTESMLLNDLPDTVEKMHALKARGVNFSLDDFGTGYSSLNYLKRLPLYQLKIDQSFVRDVLTDPNDAAIARTIVALAKNLGLEVIAEGVETEAQRDFLARIDCHAYQGYLYSRPLGIDAFEAFVRQA